MIQCTACGFRNQADDAFCGSCGGFLEWTGEQSEIESAAPVDEDEPAPKRGLLSRIQTVMSLDVAGPGEAPPESSDAPGPGGGPPGAGGPGRPGGPPGSGGGPPGGGPRPGGGPPGAGGGPPKSGGPPRPGGGAGGGPPKSGGPPRPGGGPPKSGGPGGPGGPPRPGGGPPKSGGPPRPGGGPGGGPPKSPGGPPRPGDGLATPSGPSSGAEPPATTEPDGPDADTVAALVAATPPTPSAPKRPPQTVKRTSATAGERVVGATPSVDEGQRPDAPVAVKPTKPVDRPKPVRQKPTRKILAGDLVCGECGEGNPPARHFCSRCGTTLTDAVIAKTPWWRRLVPRRRRRRLEAGERPWKAGDGSKKKKGRGGRIGKVYAKLRPIIAGALLVAGLVVGFSPNLRESVTGWLGDRRDDVTSRLREDYVPIAPIEQEATSEVEGFPVEQVVDSNLLSAWIIPASDAEPALVVRFDQPIDLSRIQVWNGTKEGFKDRARARSLHFVFDTGTTFDVELKDLPDGQEYSIGNGGGVREVEVFITDSYSSLAVDDIAISEIEFLQRR